MTRRKILLGILIVFAMICISCEEMFDVKPTKSRFDKSDVFGSEPTALSAVVGIYGSMYSNTMGFASGSPHSIGALSGLSSDELICYFDDFDQEAFELYLLSPTNSYVLELWRSMYSSIYMANSAIEGVTSSEALSNSLRSQLLGESLFVRAFSYFYLLNLYGDVPLSTGTDFEENATLMRTSKKDVYIHILNDLKLADSLLMDEYPSVGRVRPNRMVAKAMLARVYLYLEDWSMADYYSTFIVNDDRYSLETLESVFLSTSREAIWQLMPMGLYQNTNEGSTFVLQSGPFYMTQPFALRDSFLESFESGDQRMANWVGSFVDQERAYYFPFKYKIVYGGSNTDPIVPLSEYSMVMRLAEQLLIRAEARLRLGRIDLAIDDLNLVRVRSGLLALEYSDSLTTEIVLNAVIQERRVELFSEWGHRWLDLKRLDRTDSVLKDRSNWSHNWVNYPIPQNEINKNPNIGIQNSGY
jgi:starch-binding outer membrane protein, SusD/RagB family